MILGVCSDSGVGAPLAAPLLAAITILGSIPWSAATANLAVKSHHPLPFLRFAISNFEIMHLHATFRV
jgi:hypothetical protein